MPSSLTIIGSGLAAYNLARNWRARNPDAALTLVAADSGDFYSKPMLSNGLAQNKSADSLRIKRREQMANELKADILPLTRVLAIDRAAHTLQTSSGDLAWEQLVLALGADPFTPPFPGSDLPGVVRVNDIDDYTHFRNRVQHVTKVVLLGGGLIGCEFANDLASIGIEVHIVDLAGWPLNRLLPEDAGRYLQNALHELGVQCHWQTSVASVSEDSGGLNVTLANGEILHADLVLSAVGLRPRIQLASECGLAVNRGIVVDQLLRTSDPDIYALGDCAEVRGLVLPYIQPIMLAARALAATLSGEATPLRYPAMPVIVKTPACPLVVSPPLQMDGGWEVEATAAGVRALYYQGRDLQGFALLGDAITERAALTSRLPAWML